MAVPADFTTLDLSGKFTMNKTLSGSAPNTILSLQGVGWLKRTAIGAGTVTLAIKHYKGEDGVECIDIDQTLSGGIEGTQEKRIADWNEREKEDGLFGHVIGKSRRLNIDEIDDEFLKAGWTEDTVANGVLESYVSSNTPKSGVSWIARQIWGIELVNGERRYVRHVKFTGPKGENIEAKLYYDYIGPL